MTTGSTVQAALPARPGLFHRSAWLWVLLAPLLLLLPALSAFPYPSADAHYSDITLAHYPYAIYLRQALLVEHRLPLWSSLILSGSPLAANPLSGLWYPPGWLALLFPLPLGFNLLVLLHLLLGGLGMLLFLRSQGLSRPPAVLGALGFEALPKLFAHYGAGHLTLIYAVSWTPWLLWACQRRVKGEPGSRWGYILSWEAPALALIFLADVRWSAYAALLWWGWALFGSLPVHQLQDLSGSIKPKGLPDFERRVLRLIAQTSLGALLAAPLAGPLLEFTRLSTRSQMVSVDILTYSLPFGRVLGLIFPDFNGFHEYMLYAGQVTFLLGLLAVTVGLRQKIVRFWLAAFLLSLGLALGANLPPLQALATLPLFDLLRVPSRMLFISGISLLALAAYAVQAMLEGLSAPQLRKARLALTAYVGFQLVLCVGVWALGGRLPANFAWGAGFALLAAIWIGVYLAGRLPAGWWVVGLGVICLLDWGGMDRTLFWPRPAEEVLAEGRPLAQYLAAQSGEFRVYSPSYSLPQQTAATYGLQLADGVDPLQLKTYVQFMERASGVPASGYSVTLPAFSTGDPTSDNAGYHPDPRQLGLLNVRYVAAEFDLPAPGLELEQQFGSTRLYRNREVLPRAWVQPENSILGESVQLVELLNWNSDQISLRAAGPGLLVLSEVLYPGWHARIDGKPAQIEAVAGLLRGLRLEVGEHEVEFGFYPDSLYLGVGLSLLALLVLGSGLFYQRKRGRV
jgi:hypothetical protein